jgi:hypothetical protein
MQLRLLRQRVAMSAQNSPVDVLLHRLHYALPGLASRMSVLFLNDIIANNRQSTELIIAPNNRAALGFKPIS